MNNIFSSIYKTSMHETMEKINIENRSILDEVHITSMHKVLEVFNVENHSILGEKNDNGYDDPGQGSGSGSTGNND